MGFSRQEYWSGLPFPSPGDLPNPGIELRSSTLQADTLTSELPGKVIFIESVMPSNHLTLCHPFLLPHSIFPRIRVFSNKSVLCIRWPSTGVSASASVLPMNIPNQFPLGGLVGSPCSTGDSQESFPTPQFKSINSSTLSFLHSPTITSIHDHWKNHSLV